jgi:hypothetical protein
MEFNLGNLKKKTKKSKTDVPLNKEEEEQQKQEELKRQQDQQKRQQQLIETLSCIETTQSTLDMLENLQLSFARFHQDVSSF